MEVKHLSSKRHRFLCLNMAARVNLQNVIGFERTNQTGGKGPKNKKCALSLVNLTIYTTNTVTINLARA